MHLVAVRIAEVVEPGAIVETAGINDERIPIPFTDRITEPFQIVGIFGKSPSIGPNFTKYAVPLEHLNHSAGSLKNLNGPIGEEQYPRHPKRITIACRIITLRRGYSARAI